MVNSVWHHRLRHVTFRLLPVAVLVLLMGCSSRTSDKGDDETPPSPSSASEDVGQVVKFSHTYFDPPELTINNGDTVVFSNLEAMSHPLFNRQAGLDTGAFRQGDLSFTFDEPGTFVIVNTAHQTTMTVVVQ
ncbi:MAG: hypothetical protein V3S37_03795 [Dehalococcoidia bacterium]